MQEQTKQPFYTQPGATEADVIGIYTQLGPEDDALLEKLGDNVRSTLLILIESHFPDKKTRFYSL